MHLIYFFLFLILATSCEKVNPVKQKRQLIRLNTHSEPPSMDPRKASDTSSLFLINLCFEGLYRQEGDGPPKLGLAQKMEVSPDKLTYTFYLREATWWDGHPVRATDFVENWKTMLDPSFPAGLAGDLYVIAGAEEAKNGLVPVSEVGLKIIDDKTLEIRLKAPVPYLLSLLCSPAFLPAPQHIVAEHPLWAENQGEHFVGNGPFKLMQWKHHNCMAFAKNEIYWNKGLVTLEEIEVAMISDETTGFNLFETGELEWVGSPLAPLPCDTLQALAAEKRLGIYPIAGVYFYVFNLKEPPCNNANFRRALALAIDRKQIVDHVTQAHQSPALSLVPHAIWKAANSEGKDAQFLNREFFRDYDVDKAKELFALALQELGYTKEKLPSITLTYNTLAGHHKIAQAIQQQWREAFGLKVHLQNKEWKVYLDEVKQEQFQIARMGALSSFSDPSSFLDNYKKATAPGNYAGWENPRFTALIEKAQICLDPTKRLHLLKEAEELLIQEMPIIPIFFYTGTYVCQPYLKNVQLSELSEVSFRCAYIEW